MFPQQRPTHEKHELFASWAWRASFSIIVCSGRTRIVRTKRRILCPLRERSDVLVGIDALFAKLDAPADVPKLAKGAIRDGKRSATELRLGRECVTEPDHIRFDEASVGCYHGNRVVRHVLDARQQ